MPKNIAGCFRRAEYAVQWDIEHEHVMDIVMAELADWAEEVFFHEHVAAEKKDEIASDEDLDGLEMDLE
jgi:hypothetical protein